MWNAYRAPPGDRRSLYGMLPAGSAGAVLHHRARQVNLTSMGSTMFEKVVNWIALPGHRLQHRLRPGQSRTRQLRWGRGRSRAGLGYLVPHPPRL